MGPAGTDLRRIPEYVKTRVLLPQHGMYPGGGIPIAFSIVSLSFFTATVGKPTIAANSRPRQVDLLTGDSRHLSSTSLAQTEQKCSIKSHAPFAAQTNQRRSTNNTRTRRPSVCRHGQAARNVARGRLTQGGTTIVPSLGPTLNTRVWRRRGLVRVRWLGGRCGGARQWRRIGPERHVAARRAAGKKSDQVT